MVNPEEQKPVAFVIMPFDEGFDEIYDDFIVKTLREAGLEVSRADDIQSSQNILKDIVRAIKNSSLIVADLTDSNPNVFYELGLGHALNKPVIMLTQGIEDLPFDLRSYRAIPYTTHFKERLYPLDTTARMGMMPGSNGTSYSFGPQASGSKSPGDSVLPGSGGPRIE